MSKVSTTATLTRSMDLQREQPTRGDFLRFFTAQLLAHGFSVEAATAKRNSVNWFLIDARCAPSEATRESFDRFVNRRAKDGMNAVRIAGVRKAVASAFDEMCGRSVAACLEEAPDQASPSIEGKDEPVNHPNTDIIRDKPVGVSVENEKNVSAIAEDTAAIREELLDIPIDSEEKAPVIADGMTETRNELIEVLARNVGLRANEIARLRWSDVRIDQQLVILELAKASRRAALTDRATDLLRTEKDAATSGSEFVVTRPATA